MTIATPWRKVIRDVWRERTRATLVVMAIAVGLAGFLAVLSTYAILRRELNADISPRIRRPRSSSRTRSTTRCSRPPSPATTSGTPMRGAS